MESFEPTIEEMFEINLQLLNDKMYSDFDREYLVGVMPEIIQTMQEINKQDHSLMYDDLFHAICLKRLNV